MRLAARFCSATGSELTSGGIRPGGVTQAGGTTLSTRHLGVKLVGQRANVGDGGRSGGREIQREKDVSDGGHATPIILLNRRL